jgi:hypothetical protein
LAYNSRDRDGCAMYMSEHRSDEESGHRAYRAESKRIA